MGIADADEPQPAVSFDGRRRRLVDVMLKAVLARRARMVFVLEDVHWIDTPSDDVLADFAAELGATTSMFVVTYRPEFRGRPASTVRSLYCVETSDRFRGRPAG